MPSALGQWCLRPEATSSATIENSRILCPASPHQQQPSCREGKIRPQEHCGEAATVIENEKMEGGAGRGGGRTQTTRKTPSLAEVFTKVIFSNFPRILTEP